jgi:hypothetical protein
MRAADVAIIFATLIGPVLAVQAQTWLERKRVRRERQLTIFRTLMATRAALLSPQHVEALNAVPVEFYGAKGKLKEINDAWKLFFDHHVPGVATTEVWLQKRLDLLLDLLHLMSQFLGYGFSRAQLSRDIYSPQAHGDLETEQTVIRRGLVKLFNGETVLPMAVKEFPATADDETLAQQSAIQKALLDWLVGQSAVKVSNDPPTKAGGRRPTASA